MYACAGVEDADDMNKNLRCTDLVYNIPSHHMLRIGYQVKNV